MTKELKAIRDALAELLGLQDSAICLKVRAENINAKEDEVIKQLCEHIGYGAVMDSAARQWYLKDNLGCHTTYHCFGVVKVVTEKAEQALATLDSIMGVPNGYVMVPIKPTERMVMAAINKAADVEIIQKKPRTKVEDIYKAMLSAAPKHGGEV